MVKSMGIGVLLHCLCIVVFIMVQVQELESFQFTARHYNYDKRALSTIRRETQTTQLSMGLYEEDIDWDADLFGQIGNDGDKSSNTKPSTSADAASNDTITQSSNTSEGSGGWADDQWNNIEPKSQKNIKSVRDQMKQSWGNGNDMGNETDEGKPTADGAGITGPDEDEPWFTG